MPTIHIRVKGKVQGVFYRATARETAEALGVRGWVKNTPEGDVEAVVSGNEDQLRRFLEWCHQGPARARVDAVISRPVEEEDFENFRVIR